MNKFLLTAFIAAGCTCALSAQRPTIATQENYFLTPEYYVDGIAPLATQLAHRSGVGVNDKFYVNNYAKGTLVYDSEGKLLKTIPATEGYGNWVSCNADAAGHVIVQLDKHVFPGGDPKKGGYVTANGHGYMVIDSKTDEVIVPFMPMNSSSQRYDCMSRVSLDIMKDRVVSIWAALNGVNTSFRFLYNKRNDDAKPNVFDDPVQYFNTANGIAGIPGATTQVSTGYILDHRFFGMAEGAFLRAVYVNPVYNLTYSAEGKYGNAIRQYNQGGKEAQDWYYTPQHSGLTGFNIFTLDNKDYIIYPAGTAAEAADAFAISEVSYVKSPKTDMNMEGEKLVDGKLVGPIKARVYAAVNNSGSPLYGAHASCTPSYNVEPIEGNPNAVYIYVFNSGAPAAKYKFAIADEISTGIDAIETDDNAPVEYYNLQGVRVANPQGGIFIRKQGAKVTKVAL